MQFVHQLQFWIWTSACSLFLIRFQNNLIMLNNKTQFFISTLSLAIFCLTPTLGLPQYQTGYYNPSSQRHGYGQSNYPPRLGQGISSQVVSRPIYDSYPPRLGQGIGSQTVSRPSYDPPPFYNNQGISSQTVSRPSSYYPIYNSQRAVGSDSYYRGNPGQYNYGSQYPQSGQYGQGQYQQVPQYQNQPQQSSGFNRVGL